MPHTLSALAPHAHVHVLSAECNDWSLHCLLQVRPHLHGTYLVTVTCDKTAPMPTPDSAQVRRAKLVTSACTVAIALLILSFRRQLRGFVNRRIRQALDAFESAVLALSRRSKDESLLALVKQATAQGGVRRYLLYLAGLAALLRHRTTRRISSPKLAAVVAVGSAATIAASAAAAAAAATVLGIPLRWWEPGGDGQLQQLEVLRPLVERLRPILHAYLLPWLVRPALRLNSAAIHRTAALLQGDLRVKFSSHQTFASDENDGVVDLPSHLGVDSVEHERSQHERSQHERKSAGCKPCGSAADASTTTHEHAGPHGDDTCGTGDTNGDGHLQQPRSDRDRSPGRRKVVEARSPRLRSAMRSVSSAGNLRRPSTEGGIEPAPPPAVAHSPKPARNFSHHAGLRELADEGSGECSSPGVALSLSSVVGGSKRRGASLAVSLNKGRWHIMRVPGADHSLGTWASDKSDELYRELFELLDSQP